MEFLLCRMLTTMRKHSWHWFGAKSGRIQYRDKSDLIWFHKVFYAKGNSISPSSVSGLPGPTSGCLPLLWATHLTLEICKDNKNLIKMLWKGKNWNNITAPSARCCKRRRADVVDTDFKLMEKCWFTKWELLNVLELTWRIIELWMYLAQEDSRTATFTWPHTSPGLRVNT